MMSWLLLIIAGLLETCWAVGLKYTEGFTRLIPSIFVGLSAAGSMVLLAIAVRTIPVGTAYAIWVGIGALGAALLGIVLFSEPVTTARSLCLLLLLAALVGLKLTTP
jgi:quaternary ammonium compound-resistance protein SugE